MFRTRGNGERLFHPFADKVGAGLAAAFADAGAPVVPFGVTAFPMRKALPGVPAA